MASIKLILVNPETCEASVLDDEQGDMAFSIDGMVYDTFNCHTLPNKQHQAILSNMFDTVYEAGKEARSSEIAKLLGVK